MNSVWSDPKMNPMCSSNNSKRNSKGGAKTSPNKNRHAQKQNSFMKKKDPCVLDCCEPNDKRQLLKECSDPAANHTSKQKVETLKTSRRSIMNGYRNDSIMSWSETADSRAPRPSRRSRTIRSAVTT